MLMSCSYFLLPDRFSNGKENNYKSNTNEEVTTGTTPVFQASDTNSAVAPAADPRDWQSHGNVWNGGTLAGLTSKLGYLSRLGVTTIWIGPIFKQIATDENSYHGYGVQDFLRVDPRFGTEEEYRQLVKTAHQMGLYIIQDIICNHAGDVFRYEGDAEPSWTWNSNTNRAKTYPVKGFYDADHTAENLLPFGPVDPSKYPDAAIWPQEFQNGNVVFRRHGKINNWERDPEYLDGDFFTLKEFDIGENSFEKFVPTPALKALVECFKYWIAFADLDAFRLDTVKHMGWGPTRYFCNAIHEYAVSIGKENFMIVGEITGGNESKFDTVTETGLNAALGITDLQEMLWKVPKGEMNPLVSRLEHIIEHS
jgi:glycosidase